MIPKGFAGNDRPRQAPLRHLMTDSITIIWDINKWQIAAAGYLPDFGAAGGAHCRLPARRSNGRQTRSDRRLIPGPEWRRSHGNGASIGASPAVVRSLRCNGETAMAAEQPVKSRRYREAGSAPLAPMSGPPERPFRDRGRPAGRTKDRDCRMRQGRRGRRLTCPDWEPSHSSSRREWRRAGRRQPADRPPAPAACPPGPACPGGGSPRKPSGRGGSPS